MSDGSGAAAGTHQQSSQQPNRLNSVEKRAREVTWNLIEIETRQLASLQRLHAAERRLAAALRQRRGREGRRAIRQIEAERQRLGRELHTGVGQMLAAIRIQTEVVSSQLASPPQAVQQALQRISSLADEALEQVRSVSQRLHPPQWQRLPLDGALRQLWEATGAGSRFECDLRLQQLPNDPGAEIKSLFYRSAQEALSNVMRHSKATRVQLILQVVNGRLVLQVRDNGVGFNVARVLFTPPPGSAAPLVGIGLVSIREQARALGGKLLVKSGPLGTTLEVSVGLPRTSA